MGLLGKLIAAKVMAKAVQKLKQKDAAAQAARRVQHGQYIPAGAPRAATPEVRHRIAARSDSRALAKRRN